LPAEECAYNYTLIFTHGVGCPATYACAITGNALCIKSMRVARVSAALPCALILAHTNIRQKA
jgi:hypothetical protein